VASDLAGLKDKGKIRTTMQYCDDLRFLYDKAYESIKEFDSFKHIYYDHIGAESIR
jgi:hypothetical protein